MKERKNIGTMLTAILLIAALLSPSGIQLVHAFNGHEHKVCKELRTHVHEQKPDCTVCNFHLGNFDYTPSNFKYTRETKKIRKDDILSLQLSNHNPLFHKSLRAPPASGLN